jgi:hypothetical protein
VTTLEVIESELLIRDLFVKDVVRRDQDVMTRSAGCLLGISYYRDAVLRHEISEGALFVTA